MTTTIVIIIIVAILAIWLVSIYNRLVKLRNNRENAFANIDVQLKQRCDLIPQLVATVKGYATHEKETLQRVTDARAASMGAQTINEAKKYSRRTEFQRKASGAYARALKEGWIEYYTWFEPSKSKKKYNYQYTYNIALQFNKLSDFRKQHGRAYAVARKNGWINDYTWLEKKDISPKPVQQCDLSGAIIQVFGGAREASRVTGHTMSGIINCCNGKLKQHHGYIWKFKNI